MTPDIKKKAAKKKAVSSKAAPAKKVTKKTAVSTDKAPVKKATRKTAVSTKKPPVKKAARKSASAPRENIPSLNITSEERWKMIAVAAYHKAENRGFAPGGELQDWAEAEKEIDELLMSG
jgi:hypothetical protein